MAYKYEKSCSLSYAENQISSHPEMALSASYEEHKNLNSADTRSIRHHQGRCKSVV